ncbi:MAG: hypothetical protein GX567_19805 [Clostridia bacterium]|nr:hypothetical protein [Clostridia bacterium]
MIALNILHDDRSNFIECNSLLDRATFEPIPGTLDADALEVVAEYDAAIAEVEGKDAEIARLRVALQRITDSANDLLNEMASNPGKQGNWGGLAAHVQMARIALERGE